MTSKKSTTTKDGRDAQTAKYIPVWETKRGKNPSILPRIRRRIRRENEPDSRS